MSKILVLAEQQFGQLTNATLHAVTAARELANKVGGGYTIAVAGSGIDAVAQKLAGYGADAVLQFEHPALENYTAQAYAQAFAGAAKATGATLVVAAATSIGKDMVPRVAARLGAGMASDVVAIGGSAGALTFDRYMWAGNILGTVKINTAIQVSRPSPSGPSTSGHNCHTAPPSGNRCSPTAIRRARSDPANNRFAAGGATTSHIGPATIGDSSTGTFQR